MEFFFLCTTLALVWFILVPGYVLVLVQLLGDGLGLHKNTSTCIQLVQEYNLRMFLEWAAV